ncbi:MAG: hypothetical protein RIG62_30950 [Cyclobacteriaceae bacterium]
MLQKLSYVIGALLLLGAGIYAYWRYIAEDEPVPVSQLIPEDALWVYHSDQLPADWGRMQATPLGRALSTLPDVQPVVESIPSLDSIAELTSWLAGRSCYVTSQITGNDDLGFSFYVQANKTADAGFWQAVEIKVQQSSDWQIEQRQYQGVTIKEWVYTPSNARFSWIAIENFLMGSFTPFLVEDQIRRSPPAEVAENSWRQALFQNTLSQRDQGDLYVNGRQLGGLFSVFSSAAPNKRMTIRDAFCRTMLLDLTIEEDQWLLNGFSEIGGPSAQDQGQYYLSSFNKQTARPFQLSNYLPSRTASFYQFGFTNVQTWADQYTQFRNQYGPDSVVFQQLHRQFEEKTGKTLTEWFAWAGSEIGVMALEANATAPADKLIVVEIEDLASMENALQSFQDQDDSLSFREIFAGYTIRNFNDPTLPALLLGEFGEQEHQPFSECFWFQDTSFLVMSNSVSALKRLISDQRTENTWSKSVRQARFLERSLDPATFSIVLNLPRYWEQWEGQLSPKWAGWAQAHKTTLRQLEKVAVQFSPVEDEYYSSIALTYQSQSGTVAAQGFSTVEQLLLDTTLISKPFVVRNHTNQQLEVLVQDQANNVQLADMSDQSIIWLDSLGATIRGDVFQIDYYRNNKLQYLFPSDSALHLIDRTGSYVPGFPLYLPSGVQIQYFSVFDYDQSRDYRFLVTDQDGKLWMYNQDRENLPGWNPLPLTVPLAEAPQHVRVRGKDCIIALQEDGLLHAFNRRGEEYPGFPMKWEQSCHNPIFVEVGNNFAETKLTTITDIGELLSVNLEGNFLMREQLFRASPASQFLLSPDRLGKTFILARQDNQRLSILDARGKVLFEQSYFTPGALSRDELSVQYYDFGAENQVVAITDKIQEFTYLFDETGKLQNDRPIESTNEIGLLYSETNEQYRVYRVYENELSIISF